MDETLQYMIKNYGSMTGITKTEIGPDNYRVRHREIYGVPGVFISERKALQMLKDAEQKKIAKENQIMIDAFGPDTLVDISTVVEIVMNICYSDSVEKRV